MSYTISLVFSKKKSDYRHPCEFRIDPEILFIQQFVPRVKYTRIKNVYFE